VNIERIPVRWDGVDIYEQRELTARVTDAPIMRWASRTFAPDRITVGFYRRNGGDWRVGFVRLTGHVNRRDECGRTYPSQVDKDLIASQRDDWPAWVRTFVDEVTPVDALVGGAA
jgi:hypothetical protein